MSDSQENLNTLPQPQSEAHVPAGPTLPYAPAPEGRYPNVPQTEAERKSSLWAKIRLGKLAIVSAGLNAPGGVVFAATHEPKVLAVGVGLSALVTGITLHDAHNYFRNDFRPQKPLNRLIKAKTLEK